MRKTIVRGVIRPRNIIRGTIPASEIEKAYRKAFTIASPSLAQRLLRWIARQVVGATTGNPFYFADSYYEKSNEDLIRQVVAENQADKAQYITEKKDCDNFTFALMGALRGIDDRTCAMPIFILWAVMADRQAHALLSYYINGQVKLIEPQNDSVYDVPAGWELILLCG